MINNQSHISESSFSSGYELDNINNRYSQFMKINANGKKLNSKINLLKMVYWNCNSINNKIYDMIQFIDKYKPDIIYLNEIICNTYQAQNCFNQINNYNYFYRIRNNSMGGGVALLFKSELFVDEINISSEIEVVC